MGQIKRLLDKQQIRIDAHQRGTGQSNSFDSNKDVHLHKETLTPVDGKRRKVSILISLNKDNVEIKDECTGTKLEGIPTQLDKEIKTALEKKDVRDQFIRDVKNILKDYSSESLSNEEKCKKALERIAKSFGLEWNSNNIEKYFFDKKKSAHVEIKDGEKMYEIDMCKEHYSAKDSMKKHETVSQNKKNR